MDFRALISSGVLLLELLIASTVALTVIVGACIAGVATYQAAIRPFEAGTHVATLNLARLSAMTTLTSVPVIISSTGLQIGTGSFRVRSRCEGNNFSFSRPSLTLHPSGGPSFSGRFTWETGQVQQELSVGVGLTPFFL